MNAKQNIGLLLSLCIFATSAVAYDRCLEATGRSQQGCFEGAEAAGTTKAERALAHRACELNSLITQRNCREGIILLPEPGVSACEASRFYAGLQSTLSDLASNETVLTLTKKGAEFAFIGKELLMMMRTTPETRRRALLASVYAKSTKWFSTIGSFSGYGPPCHIAVETPGGLLEENPYNETDRGEAGLTAAKKALTEGDLDAVDRHLMVAEGDGADTNELRAQLKKSRETIEGQALFAKAWQAVKANRPDEAREAQRATVALGLEDEQLSAAIEKTPAAKQQRLKDERKTREAPSRLREFVFTLGISSTDLSTNADFKQCHKATNINGPGWQAFNCTRPRPHIKDIDIFVYKGVLAQANAHFEFKASDETGPRAAFSAILGKFGEAFRHSKFSSQLDDDDPLRCLTEPCTLYRWEDEVTTVNLIAQDLFDFAAGRELPFGAPKLVQVIDKPLLKASEAAQRDASRKAATKAAKSLGY